MPSIYEREYFEQEEADEVDPAAQAELIRKAREGRRKELEAQKQTPPAQEAEPPKP